MSRFKVGDRVRVRRGLEVGRMYGGDAFVEGMDVYAGQLVSIADVVVGGYRIDRSICRWTDEMFKPLRNHISEKKQKPYYVFRGTINFRQLVNDCIKDGKKAFIAVSNDRAIVGISKQLASASLIGFMEKTDMPVAIETGQPFYILAIKKQYIGSAMKYLKDIDKKVRRSISDVAKKLYRDKKSGKFSNQPETKVLTF